MARMKLTDVLRKMDIFDALSNQDLDRVAKLMRERKISENSVLFKQGDPGDALYIVQEGRIKIRDRAGAGRHRKRGGRITREGPETGWRKGALDGDKRFAAQARVGVEN